MIYKLFFENISGLLRIFTNKNINFKLTIIPIQEKNNKITYNFITNVLKFPNNIKQILTEFSFLKKNLDYPFFIDKILNFTLQISDNIALLSESINVHYNDIVDIESTNIKKNINNDDEYINELLESYAKNKNEDDDDFIFEIN
jgi:hemerythrin superfamily protein